MEQPSTAFHEKCLRMNFFFSFKLSSLEHIFLIHIKTEIKENFKIFSPDIALGEC
jgi:hypothetical protein